MLKKWLQKLTGLRPRERFVFHRIPFNFLRREPSFFIIGAQKAGTTSLFNYLTQQPGIVGPIIKEIHYFNLYYDRSISFYRAYFPIAFGKVTGEASPDYFDHPDVPQRLLRHFPNAKLIVLLREPVDRAFSHYNMAKKYVKDLGSFEEAINLEREKLSASEETKVSDLRGYGRRLSNYGFVNKGKYATHLERWLQYFPMDQFLFLDYKDLIEDPEGKVKHVCDFLHVPYTPGLIDKKIHNQGAYTSKIDSITHQKLSKEFAESNKRLFTLIGREYDWSEG